MRGLFVTGTGTGVGKTALAASLLAAMRGEGEDVRAYKPVITGLDEHLVSGQERWPPDHELLGAAAGMDAREVSPLRYGHSVSPHLAAELAEQRIDPSALIARARAAGAAGAALVVEGAGGLLVPLAGSFTMCDLAAELALPVLIAAPPGLGTINHALLTLRAARVAGLDVRAVVLTPWPEEPGTVERSNRETVARLGEVEVATLERLRSPSLEELARAGRALPWRRWLEAPLASVDGVERARASI